MKIIIVFLFSSIELVFAYSADAAPKPEGAWVIPVELSFKQLENSGIKTFSPTWVEVQFVGQYGDVIFSEIAEKVWWLPNSAALFVGSTGLPLPQRLFHAEDLRLILFHKGNVLTEVVLGESLFGHSVSIEGDMGAIQGALTQALPGIEKSDLHEIAEYCSARLARQMEQVLRATSYEVEDYGVVITNAGNWTGRHVQAQGVVTGWNNKSYLMPKGALICWTGALQFQDGLWHPLLDGNPDTRWALCDGSGGTPDLRDRFVLGAGTEPIGTFGGDNQVTLIEDQLPAHSHSIIGDTGDVTWTHTHTNTGADHYLETNYLSTIFGGPTAMGGFVDAKTYSYETASNGSHSHTFSGDTSYVGTGETQPFDVIPPYYSVAFLQHIGEPTPKNPAGRAATSRWSPGHEPNKSTSKTWILPWKINPDHLGPSNGFLERDLWLELEYTAFPDGPVLHVEPAEKVWWVNGMPLLLLGATGQPIPRTVTQRSSVYLTVRLNGRLVDNCPFQLFPRSESVYADSNVGQLTDSLFYSLDTVDATFLSEVSNFLADFLPTLNVVGTRFDDAEDQPLINVDGDWVGGDVDVLGKISGNNGLEISVPKGAIIMWSGSIDAEGHPLVNGIPILQWHECDGSAAGIPDLRDRFVVGQGSSYSIGDTGGSKTVQLVFGNLPAHAHEYDSLSTQAGSHNHQFDDHFLDWTSTFIYVLVGLAPLLTNHFTESIDWGDFSEYSGQHNHSVDAETDATGSSSPIVTSPRFYSQAFLICTGN